MRLLNVKTLQLEEFSEYELLVHRTTIEQLAIATGLPIIEYAILSHTWGEEEVVFDDIRLNLRSTRRKKGFAKIKRCCDQATKDGLKYVWIDSCCIDKRSSAELTEAINSMYKWYQWADVCYIYLSDVEADGYSPAAHENDQFSRSRWFGRGWTLQELLASTHVKFFSKDWESLGPNIVRHNFERDEADDDESQLLTKLARVTRIPYELLSGQSFVEQYSVAQKMSWASRRETTRSEDMAYSLMGIFKVNMPVLYGEGPLRAFRRLQHEIIKTTPDQSIFCWVAYLPKRFPGILAERPSEFGTSFDIQQHPESGSAIFSMTNWGLQIRGLSLFKVEDGFPFERDFELYFAVLGCTTETKLDDGTAPLVGIYLTRVLDPLSDMDCGVWRRVHDTECRVDPSALQRLFSKDKEIFVVETDQLIDRELKANRINEWDASFFRAWRGLY